MKTNHNRCKSSKGKTMNKEMKQGFSLVELMIVVVIIGALTAIMLPQFSASEADAKDTGCDASNYGTLAQLTKYNSLYGAYPSRMHTGYEIAAGTDETIMGSNDSRKMAAFTEANFKENSEPVALTVNQQKSLKKAGVLALTAGGYGTDIVFTAVKSGPSVASVTKSWYEAWDIDDATGRPKEGTFDTDSAAITINGVELYRYAQIDPYAVEAGQGQPAPEGLTKDGIVVPLFLAPTADWDHWYDEDGNENESKIGVAQAGGCPWLDGAADFRYYIGFFKVFNDGETPAKLIGTTCPECGSLNP